MALRESKSSSKRKRTVLSNDDESITNQTKVSLTMAKHLFSKQEYKESNVVFSPLSLQVGLSIIAAGSEGPTQQQLLDFLQSKSTDHLNHVASQLVSVMLSDAAPIGGPRLSFINGAWLEQTLSLQPSFKETVSSDYKAKVASVDFKNMAAEVTKEVNLWAKKETNGVIKKLLPRSSVDSLTRLVFANALYFKGAWSQAFDVLKTKNYDFHLLNGSSVKVPFMSSNEKQFIKAFDDFKVLRLPYENGRDKRQFSMYFFLPNDKDGLSTLFEKLASESDFVGDKLSLEKVKVGDFRIPRFKFSFGLETCEILKELGGTEAAAASAYSIMRATGKSFSPRVDFVADHPFLFLIREDFSGTLLFVGKILCVFQGD
ncbi:unnamed protein product [Trifolium pratense]|uniref:Uncharacterized protein n=1 Tax=Trifolium pratense TaxID=57577 RepID=A0ACB0JBL1_TRIPR|nr:unnamed protein product [Trifolium pratense]